MPPREAPYWFNNDKKIPIPEKLSGIDGLCWTNTSFRPCVYLLVDCRGDVVYVGQTVDMRRRLLEHRKAENDWMDYLHGMEFDPPPRQIEYYRCFCFSVEYEDLSAIEAALIQHFHPRYNSIIPLCPDDVLDKLKAYGIKLEGA